ncbi:MAG TPA: molybdenum cofactor guanylyltransferase [Leptolyngbyaceae cyanobacterium M65_K2018_010]|nr:molybdenum cofactor guanylyltransferase [Leptolyngbyaceae cyanobacterium M65_K2018_010]
MVPPPDPISSGSGLSTVTALVLAGGYSSRMGTDKALLQWQGKPLLQRVCEVAVQCSDRVAILTPWPERYQSALGESNGYDWLAETQPGAGPLVALAQGLEQVSTAWILLLACDMPRLRPDILHLWRQKLDSLPATTLALVPRQSEGWDPLCGFYRRSAQAALAAFIQAGGRSFQHWLAQTAAQAIDLAPTDPATSMLWNCNTPEDWVSQT